VLNLCASSPDSKLSWLHALNFLTQRLGMRVAGLHNLPYTPPGGLPQSPRKVMVGMAERDQVIINLPGEATAKWMEQGEVFTAYFREEVEEEEEEGSVRVVDVLFCYEPGEEPGESPRFVWRVPGMQNTPAQCPDECMMPAHSIAEVYLGRRSREMQDPASADSSSETCCSIVTKEV
jgi:hypothetical protein